MSSPTSDHFDGKRFFNPGAPAERGFRDLLQWKLTSRPARWPDRVDTLPSRPPPAPTGEGVAATWIGQSTFLIQTSQGSFLTDPVYSERAGPFSLAGPRRVIQPGVAWKDLPGIDAVLLSHDHYDHCDLPTLRRVAQRWKPVVVAPLGHAALLRGTGAADSVVELDWWQEHKLASGATVTLVPARHWTRRVPGDTNRRLWGGFMIRAGSRLTYFAGDSGYDGTLFPEIARRCGRPDLAVIPIGAYEPRWFMKDAHMDPREAVRVHRDVGARQSIAMHWGTFQLTDEGRDDPLRVLALAMKEQAVPEGEFLVLQPGGSVVV